MPSKLVTVLLLLAARQSAPSSAKDSVESVQARMDKAASQFKSMTANVSYVTHTDVLNENTPETGTVTMEIVQAGEVRALFDFLTPDKYSVTYEKGRVQKYLPKINTIQEWNLDKHGEQLDQFLRIGFGTSGTMLAKDYDMSVVPETVKGSEATPTIRLRLIPKAGEAKKYVKQLELWIPQTGEPYPLQEKISEPSGDYRLITYTGMKINTPLAPDALQLKIPAGVIPNREHPGK
jgi:outer membrane lipoprotein-sorting protein